MSTELATVESLELTRLVDMDPHDIFTRAPHGEPRKGQWIVDFVRSTREANQPTDTSTPDGREAIKKFAFGIGKGKNVVKKKGDSFAAEIKELPKQVDAERKWLIDSLQAEQDAAYAPLKEWEDAEEARQLAHANAIGEINDLGVDIIYDNTAEIQARIDTFGKLHAGRDFEEFTDQVNKLRIEIGTLLHDSLALRKQKDADEAELAKLRAESAAREQADRDEQMRQEGAQKAAQAAADRVAAETHRLEFEAQQAKQREADAIDRAEKAQEEAEARVKREQDAKDAEAKRLAADEANRKRVHSEILADCVAAGVSEAAVVAMMKAVAAGKVRHVTIRYAES